jgi:hypothetical protein
MRLIISVCFFIYFFTLSAQQVKLDNLNSNFEKKNILNINGGLSATTNYIIGNQNSESNLFNYFFNGNVNIRIANLINLPITFTLTNSGSNMAYPTLPNRFSLHPSYKWVTMHIGDISMNLSPYTLNGHQFTGIGVDFTPAGNFKGSVMYGRLQRKVEYAGLSTQIPAAYQRMGHGAKLRYDNKNFHIGSSYLYAYDNQKSLMWKPDSLGILPQKNTALNCELGVKPLKNLQLSGEYALSILTKDLRSPNIESNDLIKRMFSFKTSTNTFNAYKLIMNYQFLKNTIGITYDRVSSGYQTLGAYYTNNDYENLTFNFTSSIWEDKISIVGNFGAENNDLNHQNERQTRRLVGSTNVTFTPNRKFNIAAAYSNFQSHAVVKSQFNYINQISQTQNLDSLEFVQLSQTASGNLMYQLQQSERKSQSINLGLNFQGTSDKQGSVEGNLTSLINASLIYNMHFIPQSIGINASFNITKSRFSNISSVMFGPMISVSTKLLNKKVTTLLSGIYNKSIDNNHQITVFNIRSCIGYTFLKRNKFILSYIYQNRSSNVDHGKYSANVNAGYSYTF